MQPANPEGTMHWLKGACPAKQAISSRGCEAFCTHNVTERLKQLYLQASPISILGPIHGGRFFYSTPRLATNSTTLCNGSVSKNLDCYLSNNWFCAKWAQSAAIACHVCSIYMLQCLPQGVRGRDANCMHKHRSVKFKALWKFLGCAAYLEA